MNKPPKMASAVIWTKRNTWLSTQPHSMPPSVLLLPGNDLFKSNLVKTKQTRIAQSHSSYHCAHHFHPATSFTVRDVQKCAQTCNVKQLSSGKSALLTLHFSLLKQEEKCFQHNFSSILLVSNASGKCCLAVSFHCKEVKTRYQLAHMCCHISSSTAEHKEAEEKYVKHSPQSLHIRRHAMWSES